MPTRRIRTGDWSNDLWSGTRSEVTIAVRFIQHDADAFEVECTDRRSLTGWRHPKPFVLTDGRRGHTDGVLAELVIDEGVSSWGLGESGDLRKESPAALSCPE